MRAVPTWFGPQGRPLFGWLHVPEGGMARGAVVCCPTMGVEYASAHRAIRTLAEQLAAAGFLALRFDYEGTGDSSGDESGPGQLESWRRSAREAVALVRECGAARVAMVGIRIGGTLAAETAASDGDVDALVLWDPCGNGRSFVREQQALMALSIGDLPSEGVELDPGAVEVLGSVLSAETVADLGTLDLTKVSPPLARRTLVLVRDDRPTPSRLARALGTEHVEWGVAEGQADLVDVLPDQARLPEAAIAMVLGWLLGNFGASPTTVTPVVREQAVVAANATTPVVERAVRLGPLGLFGILTEPEGAPLGPTVLLLNAGLIHHIGPARLWVSLARRFAAAGMRCLRFDLSGLGDSPVRPGQPPHVGYPLEAAEDVASAAEALCPGHHGDVVLTGLCAGAYHSIENGIALGARGVCAINPILSFDPPEVRTGGEVDEGRRAVQPFSPWVKALRRFEWLAHFGEHKAPPSVWWALDRLGLQPHPAHGLNALAAKRVTTLVLCGEVEARPFERRAKWAMRRLEKSGLVRLEVLPSIDHTLFGASGRARAIALLSEYFLATYLPAPSSAGTPRVPAHPELVAP